MDTSTTQRVRYRDDINLPVVSDWQWLKTRRDLRSRFGPVEKHPCVEPWCRSPARMWSYTYGDPGNEFLARRLDRGQDSGGVVFSPDLGQYDTRCLIHHRDHVNRMENWLGLRVRSSSPDPVAS